MRASRELRKLLHEEPLKGRRIRKGRSKLAINLRLKDLPEPKLQPEQSIVINFKEAKTATIEP